MVLNQQQLEQGTNNYDEVAELLCASTRRAMEVIAIQTFERDIKPQIDALLRGIVKEEIGCALRRPLPSTKENPANKASTCAPKNLKLRLRNKISQPVLSGTELSAENQTPIEIELVDALTEEIVNSGTESTAKVEIVVLQGDDGDGDVDSWTFEEFQNKIVRERKGKRILQGNTSLHLKEGIGIIGKINFSHNADWTKNGKYRLGAIAVDPVLMTKVEGARSEAFLIKDKRSALYEKHHPPYLSDRVYRLEMIGNKGAYYNRLKDAEVNTVKEFLTILLTNPKRLEKILQLKASSKPWDNMVSHAQTCNGMFLYIDPSHEQRIGVVIDVKQQLKGLIEESQYIPVDQLSQTQKVESQKMVKSASESLEVLESFDDETSLKEYLQSNLSFNLLPSSKKYLKSTMVTDGLPGPSSQATCSHFGVIEGLDYLDNSNLYMGQSPNNARLVTYPFDGGEEIVPGEKEMTYAINCYQPDISFHAPSLEIPDDLNIGPPIERHAQDPTRPGNRVRDVDVLNQSDGPIHSPDFLEEYLHQCLTFDTDIHFENLNDERSSEPENFDADIMIVAQAVSVRSTTARTRWTKVPKLLRRLSIRKRIGLPIGIHAQKKQRCC